jgi:hypothetical protein
MEAQQASDDGTVRKETDAQIFTVTDDCDTWVGNAAMRAAAEENGDNPDRAGHHYTYEVVREFANSTMVAAWDTRE